MSMQIIIGDCRNMLRTLPDESVHCVVTSPPYWGLRDYGVNGQIGLETNIKDYVSSIVDVFREVRRVLRKDGTIWLNLGDSYATAGGYGGDQAPSNVNGKQRTNKGARLFGRHKLKPGFKEKDLCGIPWRVAFALQDDGWWLRQDIIWSKPNPMPESVTDRCTKAHEYLFLLSKSERYYFDAAAIAEPAIRCGAAPGGGHRYNPDKINDQHNRAGLSKIEAVGHTRNKRSVWEVATQAYSEAHFATFPAALIEPCIKAGCPTGGTVLDPFAGAGTTGLVADRLQRNAILIELNPDYIEIARNRIQGDAPLFAVMTWPQARAGQGFFPQ